ncbi:hypothetical protein PIB30_072799, partial [Stylosanthes scabra]|nr:hypothetical protein [Stylosanthes scabra]
SPVEETLKTGTKRNMEEKQKHKQKQMERSMNEILPLELIQRILLRVPAKHLARLRFVSKLWHSLISDPHFAKLHFNHSPAATNTNAWLYKRYGSVAFLKLDALFGDHNDASLVKEVSPPFEMNPSSYFVVRGSCRGFVSLRSTLAFSCGLEPAHWIQQKDILPLCFS